jgi:endoglycosylceramidase
MGAVSRALALLAVLFATSPLLAGPLRVDGRRFADARGGTVFLRGLNLTGDAKVPPFRGVRGEADLDPLPGWGLNAARLLFTWEAFEPSPGQYAEDYLAYQAGVIDALHARGLYVIIDFHQDAYARFALDGCGEGFPAWALPPDVPPATPDNSAACADWGARMISDPTLEKIWRDFYADTHGARGRFLQMIGRVAARFTGHPAVIGYDLLNEPGGDEVTGVAPFHAAAAAAIRAADPSAIVFVSPGAVTSAGEQTRLPRPAFDNFAYAPHYYDPIVFLLRAFTGGDLRQPFSVMESKAAEWGVPLLVGEYGAAAGTDGADDYLGVFRARLDENLASGTQWVYTPGWTAAKKDGWNAEDFSIVDDRGALRDNFRPRAQVLRTAGAPGAITLTPDAIEVRWTHAPAAGETEIYAPPEVFAAPDVRVESSDGITCRVEGPRVRCGGDATGEARVRVVGHTPSCGLTGLELLALAALRRRRRARRR